MGDLLVPILVLMALFTRAETGPPPSGDALGPTLATLAIHLVGLFALSRLLFRGFRNNPRGIGAASRILGLANFALYMGLVFLSNWVPLSRYLTLDLPLLNSVLAISPFLVGHAIVANTLFDLSGRPSAARRDSIILRLRTLAVLVVPLLLLKGIRDLLSMPPGWEDAIEAYLPLLVLELMGSLVIIYALSPLLIRFVVGAKPMPAGPLRERLTAYNKRVGFKPNDILIWNTGGAMPNALYIGILPGLRYVVITDALLKQLDPAAVEGVYAHEAGHGMRRHMQLFLLLFIGFYLFMLLLAEPLLETLTGLFPQDQVGGALAELISSIALMVVPILCFFAGFGWLSRRFETEADLFAVDTVADPADFGRALETVGLHAGILSRRGGMRHFGIGRRLGLMNRYLCEPDFRDQLRTVLSRCRLGIVAFFLLGTLALVLRFPTLMRSGEYKLDVARAITQANKVRDRETTERALAKILPYISDPAVAKQARDDATTVRLLIADVELLEGNYDRVGEILRTLDATKVTELEHVWNIKNLRAQYGALRGGADRDFVRGVIREFVKAGVHELPENGDCMADLYLAARALGSDDPPPGKPKFYQRAAARLLLAIESEDPAPADLDRLVERAEHEHVYARDAFMKARGGDTPTIAARKRFGQP